MARVPTKTRSDKFLDFLLDQLRDVDEVIAYDAAMPRFLRPMLLPRRARAFAEQHLAGRFDLAVVPRWDTDHHLATVAALFSVRPGLSGLKMLKTLTASPRI